MYEQHTFIVYIAIYLVLHTYHLAVSDLDRRGEAVRPLLPRFGERLLDLDARAERTLAVGMPASEHFCPLQARGFQGVGIGGRHMGAGKGSAGEVVDMAAVVVADTTPWRYSTIQ